MQNTKFSLKKIFLQIVIFGSLIPLCFSFLFLFYIIKLNKERLEAYNTNQSHIIELSIQNEFNRVVDTLYKIELSQEFKKFLNTTFQNESIAHKDFKKFLIHEKTLLKSTEVNFCIYSGQGSVLYEESNCPRQKSSINKGLYFLENKNLYLFYIPYWHKSRIGKHQVTIAAVIPLNRLKNQYPLLHSLNLTSPNLDKIILKANLGLETFDKKISVIFYMTILFCTLISIFSILYGMKISHFLKLKAEEALQFAAIGKIAHLLAHDIKKPFETINFFTEKINSCKSKEDTDALILDTKQAIQSSQSFINNILKELMDANTQSLNLEDNLSLNDILTSCFSSLNKNSFNHVAIKISLSHTLQLNGDKTKLSRAFLNIIANAIEAIDPTKNSTIEIKSFDYKNFIRIIFSNSNSFIPPQDLSKIFDPFYTTKSSGTGLGLAISKRMIKLHKGTIHCESNRQSGVKFMIDLPGTEGNYVFVIDDCPLALRAWEQNCKNADKFINVHSFLNFRDFFDFIKSNQIKKRSIKTIICDYYIPNSSISLPSALKKIRKFYSKSIYIATHMDKTIVKNHLKNFDVIIIDKI